MSKVIKRVPLEFITIEEELVECQNCGSGRIIEEGHPTYQEALAQIGTKCSCGGTYEHKVLEYQQKQGGYTVVECDCGRHLSCYGFTTTCECGRDYNWNGSQLAPRSQWGYETGEVF